MFKISIPSDNPEVKEILEEIAEVCGELLFNPQCPVRSGRDACARPHA